MNELVLITCQFFATNQQKTKMKNNRDLACIRFPVPGTGYNYVFASCSDPSEVLGQKTKGPARHPVHRLGSLHSLLLL